MKFPPVLVFILAIASASAQEVWHGCFDAGASEARALAVSQGDETPDGAVRFRLPPQGLALDAVAPGKWAPSAPALLWTEFENDVEETLCIGISADWWFTAFANGEKIGTTEPGGNASGRFVPSDHLYSIALKKGVNRIAVRVRRGSAGSRFAFAVVPRKEDVPESIAGVSFGDFYVGEGGGDAQEPVRWVTDVAPRSAEVGVRFERPMASGVRWRKVADGAATGWNGEMWTMMFGQKDRVKLHRFYLDALVPATEYEYEIIRLDEAKAATETVASGRFATFSETFKPFSFWATSDLQVSQEMRSRAVRDMILAHPEFKKAAFYATLGDVDSAMNDVPGIYLDSVLDVARKHGADLPVVTVRGNHEYREKDSGDFGRLFGRPYGSFLCNGVFFIALDTGEDKPLVSAPSHYTLRTDTEAYMDQQAEWLREVVASEACRRATRRIVLAHATPFEFENPYYHRNIKRICGDLFYGESPACPIDLWLCGDIHTSYCYDPVSRSLRASPGRSRAMALTAVDAADIRFPVYVNDGPGFGGVNLSCVDVNISENSIAVTCSTPEGRVLDRTVFRKGAPAEIQETTFQSR